MPKIKAWASCDPGATGYWCLLCPEEESVAFISTLELPGCTLDDLTGAAQHRHIVMLALEDVHSLGNMSAKANFSFGYNVGIVNVLAQLSRIPTVKVQPRIWQKAVGIKSKRWPKGTRPSVRTKYLKQAVAEKCTELYPYALSELYGPRGGLQDGKSDALMLAHYARLTYPT